MSDTRIATKPVLRTSAYKIARRFEPLSAQLKNAIPKMADNVYHQYPQEKKMHLNARDQPMRNNVMRITMSSSAFVPKQQKLAIGAKILSFIFLTRHLRFHPLSLSVMGGEDILGRCLCGFVLSWRRR